MECLHGKPASSSTTQNGVFWFCGQKPSCEFFCPEEDCYMFGKAVASFHKSKCIHPTCYTHGKLAQMRMVKDKMKESYGRPYFVCSDRNNPCSFWQWADVAESPKPICRHDLVCRTSKVKKDGPNHGHLFYCCPKDRENSCGFFEWKPVENSPRIYNIGCLFSSPGRYRYMVADTDETFTSSKNDPKEAYEEFLHRKSIDELVEDMTKLNIC